MVSPVVQTVNSAWASIKESWAIIAFLLTVVTLVSLSAGQAIVSLMIDEKLNQHNASPVMHSDMKIQQAVILNRLGNIEEAITDNSDSIDILSIQLTEAKGQTSEVLDKMTKIVEKLE